MNKNLKELQDSIKDKIIAEIFNNDNLTPEEKISFCQELESFGEGWRTLIFASELEKKKEVKENDLSLEKLRMNIK